MNKSEIASAWKQWINQEPAWIPRTDAYQTTRLGQFVRQVGLPSVQALRDEAANDPAWFWQHVEQELQWPWFTPYHTVLDVSRGKAWAQWFVGGTTNWVEKVARMTMGQMADMTAIIAETESGEVRSWTYGTLMAEAHILARSLHQKWGVKQGDTIGLVMPMVGEAAVALVALGILGAIAVPLFSGYGVDAIGQRLTDAEVRYVIVADGVVRRGKTIAIKAIIDQVVEHMPWTTRVLVVNHIDRVDAWFPQRDFRWRDFTVPRDGSTMPIEPLPANHPCLLLYTSGTTGKPKGTVHGHGGLPLKAAQDLWHAFDVGPGDVLFWMTDLGWMMGPWAIIGGLLRQSTVVLYDGAPDYPTVQRLWSLVKRHAVTVLGLAPTLIRGLMTQPGSIPQESLSSLRVLGSTGEPWDPESWYWFFKHVGQSRCPIINYSGGTEIGGGILGGTLLEPLYPCAFSGPVPGMAVMVADEWGKPVQNAVGELVVTQPWPGMTQGFWHDSERYQESYWSRWPGRWAHGDWAVATDQGAWFILGRTDDTLKIAGKRIGPAEVEAVLLGDDTIAEAAVVGIPDPIKGEVLAAFIVIMPDVVTNASWRSSVMERAANALGKPLRPSYLVVVPALPKTRNGKIMRRVVRATALGEAVGDLAGLENPEVLAEIPCLVNKT